MRNLELPSNYIPTRKEKEGGTDGSSTAPLRRM